MTQYKVHNSEEAIEICEPFLRWACHIETICPKHHIPLPYLWQIQLPGYGWYGLDIDSDTIEKEFCRHDSDGLMLKTKLGIKQTDGTVQVFEAQFQLCFSSMQCASVMQHETGQAGSFKGIISLRRLSTPSYVELNEEHHFGTAWTWKWKSEEKWNTFETDSAVLLQTVLEKKFLHSQELYRFEVEVESKRNDVYFINFRTMKMSNLSTNENWILQRRPKYVSKQDVTNAKYAACYTSQLLPYTCKYPENWAPVDSKFDYELVPLNPQSMEYHLVVSELEKSLNNREVKDIFRIQNPYLWHKYDSKKKQFSARGLSLNEQQLFHGTSKPDVVEAIFRQNFDWRMCGANGTRYGQGTYFAKDAKYSDRYTNSDNDKHWMFMARVLIGRSTEGKPEYKRPPPIDPAKPHGDLYDSCVNTINKPVIYVLFDSDQYYPEYVICYSEANCFNS